MKLEISYNRASGLWEVFRPDARVMLQTKRVALNAPAMSSGQALVVDVPPEQLKGDDKHVRLGVPPQPMGPIKHREMREWVAIFEPESALWVVWRHDHGDIVVTTKSLELTCECVTVGQEIHCLAEMILEGHTNRMESVHEAKTVMLRRLEVFDQICNVPVVGIARSAMKAPGTR